MLTLCTRCSRHARADEPRCPFCEGALAPPRPPRKVLSRSRTAILFGTALAAIGCGGGSTQQETTVEDEVIEQPVEDDTTEDQTQDTQEITPEDMQAIPAYGVPAPEVD